MNALESAIEPIAEEYDVGFYLEANDDSAEVYIAEDGVSREEMGEMAKELKMVLPYERFSLNYDGDIFKVRLSQWTSL